MEMNEVTIETILQTFLMKFNYATLNLQIDISYGARTLVL